MKITLIYSDPAIWRRVVVPANFKLDRLHQVIQRVMPWTDSHLHQFIVGRTCYDRPDPEFADKGSETLNEKHYTIADIAPGAKTNSFTNTILATDGNTRLSSKKCCRQTPVSKESSAWLAKVQCEWSLTTLAYNLKRVLNLVSFQKLMAAVA